MKYMSELADRIAEVIRTHRPQGWNYTHGSPMCSCGDDGDHAAHVAERIEAELGLTVEPGWVRESNGTLEHAVVGWVQPYTSPSA